MVKVRECPGNIVYEFDELTDAAGWMFDLAHEYNLEFLGAHNKRYSFKHRINGDLRVFTILEDI